MNECAIGLLDFGTPRDPRPPTQYRTVQYYQMWADGILETTEIRPLITRMPGRNVRGVSPVTRVPPNLASGSAVPFSGMWEPGVA